MAQAIDDLEVLDTTVRVIDRAELASFLPTQRLIVAFENMNKVVADGLPAAVNAQATAIRETDSRVADLSSIASAARGAATASATALAELRAYFLGLRDDRARLADMQRQIDELRTLTLGA